MLIETFMTAAIGKVSPAKLIQDNREWLQGFVRVRPLLARLDLVDTKAPGKLFPTQALQAIVTCLSHEKDTAKDIQSAKVTTVHPKGAGKGAAKPGKGKAEVEPSPKVTRTYKYTVRILLPTVIGAVLADEKSTVGADTYQDAQQKAFNRLVRSPSDAYAEVSGPGGVTRINRNTEYGGGRSAMAAIFGKKLGGKQSSVNTGKMNADSLQEKISCHHDHFHFSHG